MESNLFAQAQALGETLMAHRRQLHQNPELGLNLPKTSAYVWKELEKLGYTPHTIGTSSIVAEIGEGDQVFLLRADMDALPIQEETGLPYASTIAGCMHACGHDCHAAMLLGAAALLRQNETELQGRVRLFFQAGEEVLDGAKEAVEAGLLTNPPVSAGMMIHVVSGVPIPTGSICFVNAGACYASADWFRVDIQGKGGHGAMPQSTISAINTACAINAGIQEIRAVMVAPSANACITVGELHAGDAESGNIIPATAHLAGTIRTFDEEVRGRIRKALEEMATQTAAARGATAAVTYSHTAPVVMQDATLRQEIMTHTEAVLGSSSVVDLSRVMGGAYGKISGSEDFAYIAEQVPCGVALLAAGSSAEGYTAPSHNPKTNFNESALPAGAATYAAAALGWLKAHG